MVKKIRRRLRFKRKKTLYRGNTFYGKVVKRVVELPYAIYAFNKTAGGFTEYSFGEVGGLGIPPSASVIVTRNVYDDMSNGTTEFTTLLQQFGLYRIKGLSVRYINTYIPQNETVVKLVTLPSAYIGILPHSTSNVTTLYTSDSSLQIQPLNTSSKGVGKYWSLRHTYLGHMQGVSAGTDWLSSWEVIGSNYLRELWIGFGSMGPIHIASPPSPGGYARVIGELTVRVHIELCHAGKS